MRTTMRGGPARVAARKTPTERSASARPVVAGEEVRRRAMSANGTQTVGVRELKASLSSFLRRVEQGESLVVTDRGRPVARLSPPDIPEGILRMMREGKLVWSGRKPDFDRFPPVKLGPGPTLADILIADRHRD